MEDIGVERIPLGPQPPDVREKLDDELLALAATDKVPDGRLYRHCMAMLQHRSLERQARASEMLAVFTTRLVWATWGLVAATVMLVVVTIALVITTIVMGGADR